MDERDHPAQERGQPSPAASSEGAGATLAKFRAGRFSALMRGARGDALNAGSRLAVDELPDEVAQLAPGKLYAIYAKPRTAACDALIWNTAKAARTRYVTIVLSRSRAKAAEQMRSLGFGAGAPARGWPRDLNVLAMPDDALDHAAHPAEQRQDAIGGQIAFARLFGGLRALKRFGFRSNALYFVEGAERWLTWDDPDALAREGRLLANWCDARRIALVLLLDPSRLGSSGKRDEAVEDFIGAEPIQQAGHLEFHGACAGVARMGRTHGELLWHVDFWRTGRALTTGETRALRYTEDGRLSVAPEVSDGQAQAMLRLARDESRVVATKAVVARESWVPPEWEIVEDQQAAVATCVGALAATVLLDYRDRSTLEALCSAVHTLRRECGRALKIVIVERREALRHQYELLLLSLGANLIIGRELPFSRVQSLLRSLQGQLDTRPVAVDYQAALAAALTDDVRGYLPVAAYCERVKAVLARGAVLDLPHVLAKITLLPEVAHVDALAKCAPRRAGDVVTADPANLYVFLFACRLPDADIALGHIFTVPVEQLSDRVVYLAEGSIEREIQALAEANRRTPIPDYSDLFPAAPARAPWRAAQGAQDVLGIPGAQAAQTLEAVQAAVAAPERESDAASQLHAVESLLDRLKSEETMPPLSPEPASLAPSAAAPMDNPPRSTPRAPAKRRGAEPWPMPVRGEGGEP